MFKFVHKYNMFVLMDNCDEVILKWCNLNVKQIFIIHKNNYQQIDQIM